jgi:hypothetical protein
MVAPTSHPPHRKVEFNEEPTIRYIDKSPRLRTRTSLNMSKQLFEKFDEGEITDDMLVEASQLFNENYGIWGKDAAKSGAFAKPGQPV